MHCTWFNEKKKKVNFPYIFFFCGLFPLLIRPHICRPHRPSPAPHNTTWERSATPTPPRSSQEYLAGHLGPRPSWPAASDLARGCAPQTHSARSPTVFDRPKRRTRPDGQGPSFASS